MHPKRYLLLLLPILLASTGAASASDGPASAAAGATEVQLIHAVTDEDAGIYDFRGVLDANKNLSAVHYYRRPWGEMLFSLARINGPKPVPVVNLQGRDIVLLKGRGVDSARGGRLSLILLRSGVDADLRELHLELVRGPDASWQVFAKEKSGRKRVDTIAVQHRSIPIIGKVGVGKVFAYFNGTLVDTYSTGDLDSY